MAEPRPEATGRLLASTLIFTLLCLGAVVAAQLRLPFGAAALLFLAPALVVGGRALVQAVRGRAGALAVLTLTTGLLLAVMVLVATGVRVAFWPVAADYDRCVRDAITESATEQCRQHLLDTMTAWVDQ